VASPVKPLKDPITGGEVDPAPDDSSPSVDPPGTKRRKAYGKVAKRGVAWSFLREGVSEMITTPTAMIIARLLTPFDFGVAASAGFFLTLATRLTNFGFNQALVRIRDLKQEHCSAVFVVSMLTGAVAYGVLVGTAPFIGAFFRTPAVAEVMPIAALTFLITPLGTVSAALMTRDMQFKRTAATDWLSSLVEAVLTIILAWKGFSFWSVVYGRVAGSAINSAAKILLGKWRPSLKFSMAALRELLSFGTGIFAKRLLDYTARNLDNLVVGRMLGMVSLGLYDKAFTTMNKVLVRINTGGPVVSFRVFSIISDERERFQRACRKVLLASSLVSYPVLLGLAACGAELIVVMYGERWSAAVPAFQILCAAGALKVLNEYAGSAAQAGGRIWDQVGRQIVYTLLIVIGVAAFSGAGLAGAAFGVLLATIVMTWMMLGLLSRVTGLSTTSLLGAQVPGFLAALCVSAAILATRFGLVALLPEIRPWQLLPAELLAGTTGYLAFLKFARFREVRSLIRDTSQDLAPPLGSIAKLLT
jgi:O-antigen/teichoic acid export membrane protein